MAEFDNNNKDCIDQLLAKEIFDEKNRFIISVAKFDWL